MNYTIVYSLRLNVLHGKAGLDISQALTRFFILINNRGPTLSDLGRNGVTRNNSL